MTLMAELKEKDGEMDQMKREMKAAEAARTAMEAKHKKAVDELLNKQNQLETDHRETKEAKLRNEKALKNAQKENEAAKISHNAEVAQLKLAHRGAMQKKDEDAKALRSTVQRNRENVEMLKAANEKE